MLLEAIEKKKGGKLVSQRRSSDEMPRAKPSRREARAVAISGALQWLAARKLRC